MARALLQYRNTPSRKDGQSPAQKLFGRPMQDTLPAHHRSFAPEWQRSTIEAEQLAANTLAHSESYYNGCLLICGTEWNGTPDSAKYLFCGTHQNEPKQLPSFVVIVLNKIEQKFTLEK